MLFEFELLKWWGKFEIGDAIKYTESWIYLIFLIYLVCMKQYFDRSRFNVKCIKNLLKSATLGNMFQLFMYRILCVY